MSPTRKKTAVDRRNEQVRAGQRRAARRPCPVCKADTLHGLDGDVLAFTVTCDVAHVGAAAELVAVSGENPRGSFWVLPNPEGVELHRRDPWSIRARPAGHPEGWPVVLEHQCPGAVVLTDPNGGAGLFDVPPGHNVGTPRTQRIKKETPRA